MASNEQGVREAANFSLASEIVELVVLTTDEATLKMLREAVSGGSRRLWHVGAADKISDLLVAGDVGIVILDAHELGQAASRFIGEITRQFPDLVVVVTGRREDQRELAHLISGGAIYRFIHKPLSPGRARLFIDAAVRRYGEQRPAPPDPVRIGRSVRYRVAALLAALLAAGLWLGWQWMTATHH